MRRRRYRTRELSIKVECKDVGIVTLVRPVTREASPQIMTIACRKDAKLDSQRAVSEEGLPCIENLHDKDRVTKNVNNERAKREDLHTSMMGDSVGRVDAIHANTIIST